MRLNDVTRPLAIVVHADQSILCMLCIIKNILIGKSEEKIYQQLRE
jgi:hypothetical protein